MPNNYLIKFFCGLVLTASLVACQTVPKPSQQTESPAKPDDSETMTATQTTEEPPAPTLFQQAMQSTQDGNVDKAIQQFEQLVIEAPSTKRAYTNLGLLYLHKKQNDKAKEAFQSAIQQDKKDAIAYNHLAVIQRQQGEFTQALYNYYNAINADSDYANAHLNLGILLDIYLQDLPKALEQYEIFQQLTGNSNEQVGKWVIDIKRRIEASKGK